MEPSEQITILFLAANPDDQSRLALGAEYRDIQHRVKTSTHHERLSWVSAWAVRGEDIIDALLDHRPRMVHFCAHGDGSDNLLLVDDDHTSRPVTANSLAQILGTLNDEIALVVFNACFTLALASAVTEHIDCAIGTEYPISDSSARIFASRFYQALGFGRSILSSFEIGASLAVAPAAISRNPQPASLDYRLERLEANEAACKTQKCRTVHFRIVPTLPHNRFPCFRRPAAPDRTGVDAYHGKQSTAYHLPEVRAPRGQNRCAHGLSPSRASVNLDLMDDASGRLIREFMLVANAIMNRIPRPVPEGPEGGPWESVLQELDEWDGELLDVRALHHAYNRLPADLQDVVESGYGQCLEVLAHQHHTAMRALNARCQVFADVMDGTGLAPEQLIPDLHSDAYMQPDTGLDNETPDDSVVRTPLRLVPPIVPIDDDMSGALFGHGARRLMRRTLQAGLVAGLMIAAGGISNLAWQRSYAPPPASHKLSSDVSMSSMSDASVGAAPYAAPSFADDATVCMPSPDARAVYTDDTAHPLDRVPATLPATLPTTSMNNLDERDATRSNRTGSNRALSVMDIGVRDSLIDQSGR